MNGSTQERNRAYSCLAAMGVREPTADNVEDVIAYVEHGNMSFEGAAKMVKRGESYAQQSLPYEENLASQIC